MRRRLRKHMPTLPNPPFPHSATYDGSLELDLGNLAAFDPVPLTSSSVRNAEATTALATRAAQSLVTALWTLPSSPAPVGRLADLPRPATPLPRCKPPPAPRPPTRWEAFAAQKGIAKRKRSKLVFDDDAGEWRRRHGYKRAGDDADVVVVDAKPGDVVGSDPFTEAAAARRDRVRTNAGQRLANLKAEAKAKGGGALALPPTLRLAAALPAHGKGKPTRAKDARAHLKAAADAAGVTTASLGKHDALAKGESRHARSRALEGSRHKFEPVVGGRDSAATRSIVDKIVRTHADDIVDAPLATSRLEAERRAEKRERGGGGGEEDWRARGRAKAAGGGARRSKFGRPIKKGWTKDDASKAKHAKQTAAIKSKKKK